MTKKETLLRRRDSIIRGYTRRGRLTAGVPPRDLDDGFLQRLKEVDPDLELYWHPLRGQWIVYRLFRKGASPADDRLIAVSRLVDWPGEWLIRHLRERDMMRRHPEAGDADRAAKLDMDDLDAADEQREEASTKKYDALYSSAQREVDHVDRGRMGVLANDTVEPAEKKRQIIWSSKEWKAKQVGNS
jgi:hypothetical protein